MSLVKFSLQIPEGEDRERRVCNTCGFIDYVNPRIVVGSVARTSIEGNGDRILLCKRAIEPRKGFWTLPAGFLETGESVEDGARREAKEEALADLELRGLLAVYSIPRIAQVQVMFRARLLNEPAPGPESEAVDLFRWADIPWAELAFPSVKWALEQDQSVDGKGVFAPFSNPAGADTLTR